MHPGEILGEELQEFGMSANALAKTLGVPTNRITAILNGQRGITADTALRLARYFGTTPQIWLNLQQAFELRVAEIEVGKDIMDQVHPQEMTEGVSAVSPDVWTSAGVSGWPVDSQIEFATVSQWVGKT
jgi:addiction module HigA family antidote